MTSSMERGMPRWAPHAITFPAKIHCMWCPGGCAGLVKVGLLYHDLQEAAAELNTKGLRKTAGHRTPLVLEGKLQHMRYVDGMRHVSDVTNEEVRCHAQAV